MLRARCRERRKSLTPAQRTRFDTHINNTLIASDILLSVRCISAYCAFDGEPDIAPALHVMHQRGQQICLPVIDQANQTMAMYPWSPATALNPGALGIMEPDTSIPVAGNELDVVLMPLVAWDGLGNRIGMGGGFYDRYLSDLKGSDRPLKLGVAYDLQSVDRVPALAHDIGLHALVSESGWSQFTQQ
ncbi:MAG: 5-formyltetrahydrofolate cyclo-ligase [Xanthomonadales bacterium]|nr:5-formyltetrahydrofolate cyclo-ligase [Xanthomonadales bacterium]